MQLGKLSSEDLRLLLTLLPMLEHEEAEVKAILHEKSDKIFTADSPKWYWCQFYEMPFLEHLGRVLGGLEMGDQLKQIADAPSQIEAASLIIEEWDKELEAWNPDEEEKAQFLKGLPFLAAISFSISYSFRSLLTFGCYLNDLVARARSGDDQALFNAIKIDPTVVGCPTVIARISRATLESDRRFFAKLKAAFNGKINKREDKTYRKMRFVLKVLQESGAERLSNDELYALFVKELKLYSETSEGDPVKALRKFADQYMKTATT